MSYRSLNSISYSVFALSFSLLLAVCSSIKPSVEVELRKLVLSSFLMSPRRSTRRRNAARPSSKLAPIAETRRKPVLNDENLEAGPSRKRRKHSIISRKPFGRVDSNVVSVSGDVKSTQLKQSARSARRIGSSVSPNKDRITPFSPKQVTPPAHTENSQPSSKQSSETDLLADTVLPPLDSQSRHATAFSAGPNKSSMVPAKRAYSHMSPLPGHFSSDQDNDTEPEPSASSLQRENEGARTRRESPVIISSSPQSHLYKNSGLGSSEATADLETTIAEFSPLLAGTGHVSSPLILHSPEKPPVPTESPEDAPLASQRAMKHPLRNEDISSSSYGKNIMRDFENHVTQSLHTIPVGDEVTTLPDKQVQYQSDSVIRRPTNMATPDEDVILPVISSPKRKRSIIPSSKPLWRPTNMASPDEDIIVPISPSLFRRTTSSPNLSEAVQLDTLRGNFASDAATPNTKLSLFHSNGSKTNRNGISLEEGSHLEAQERSASRPVERVQPTSLSATEVDNDDESGGLGAEKDGEDHTITSAATEHSTEQQVPRIKKPLPAQLRMGAADNKPVSSRRAKRTKNRRQRGRSGPPRRRKGRKDSLSEEDVHRNDDSDHDKEEAGSDMEASPSNLIGWRKESPLRASRISLSSESSPDLDRTDLTRRSDIPTRYAANEQTAFPSPRKHHVVTYSRRMRNVQQKVTLPSTRALGIWSQSPTVAEVSQQTSENDASESSLANDRDESDEEGGGDDVNEKVDSRRDPKHNDFLQAFYVAQRQLWKEVDEISLEEDLDLQ